MVKYADIKWVYVLFGLGESNVDEPTTILGIFSTRELAIAAKDEFTNANDEDYRHFEYGLEIRPFKLD